MIEGEPWVTKKVRNKNKFLRGLFDKRSKKSCCGKKKCTCNPKKEEKLCERSTGPVSKNRNCVCGKIDCECYGSSQKPPKVPKFLDIYKCGYAGDEAKAVCVCGKPDCTCHSGRKSHIKEYEIFPSRIKECEFTTPDQRPPCVCGKPYCTCRGVKHVDENIPEIEFVHVDNCTLQIAPVKNYCVCGKPDCTCYQDNQIVDDDDVCNYRVPLVRPLCVCGKMYCNCNVDRIDEKQIPKKIKVPDAPARCVCGKIFCECNIGRASPASEEKIRNPDDKDITIELEKSNYVKEREKFLRSFEVPSLTDAKHNLGELADFVYDHCDAGLRTYIPTVPQMQYGDLWVSPSDLLIPHVGLKAPLTRKHMQALTHEAILDIGYQIELRFLNQMEMEKEDALESQRQELTKKFQDSIQQMIKDVEVRERAACQREIQKITEEFEQNLKDELNAMQARLQKEFEEFTETHDEKLNLKWEQKLKLAVEETTRNITRKFLEELAKQEEILKMYFKADLAKKEMQRIYELEKQQFEHNKEMQQVKHRLECKNIANMMYILCMERRKCSEEKENIEKYYKKKIEGLNTRTDKHKRKIAHLKQEIEQQLKQVQLRETCVLEILKQYQKFINFALKAAPTQAEFLLSIERIMIFELTDALMKLKPPSKHDLRPCEVTLPWLNKSPSEEIEALINEAHGLEVKDYHECFNELAIPKKKEDMVLPAFIFKKKLYVREDFRNMMSQGIKPSPSNALWSDDVDALMETLRGSVSEDELEEESRSASSTEMPKKILKGLDKTSAIQFKFSTDLKQPLADLVRVNSLDAESVSIKGRVDTKTSLKYSMAATNPVDHSKVGIVETNPFLLGTQSSLELLAKKYKIPRRKKASIIPERVSEELIGEEIFHKEESNNFIFAEKLDLDCRSKDAMAPFVKCQGTSDSEIKIKATSKPEETQSKGTLELEIKSTETLKAVTDDAKQLSFTFSRGSRNEQRLSTETRDSVILGQSSIARAQKSFSISPNDSIEVKKNSPINAVLKKQSSKLVAARDSVELLRKSRSLLKEPIICSVCHKREDLKKKEIVPRECEKCAKHKESFEVLSGGIIPKNSKIDESDHLKQIKLSHVEIIPVKDEQKSNVVFKKEPTTIIEDYEKYAENLSKLYQPPKKKIKEKKKKQYEDPCERRFEPKAQIVGEPDGKEHLQNEHEFTVDRMRSFISIMSNHPNLIKMFTACQR